MYGFSGLTWVLFGCAVVATIWSVSKQVGLEKVKQESQARSIEIQTLKSCPFCAEKIQKEATVCRWCNRDLVTP